jgi:hypothetical protein
MKMTIFWDVNQSFRGACCLHHQGDDSLYDMLLYYIIIIPVFILINSVEKLRLMSHSCLSERNLIMSLLYVRDILPF